MPAHLTAQDIHDAFVQSQKALYPDQDGCPLWEELDTKAQAAYLHMAEVLNKKIEGEIDATN